MVEMVLTVRYSVTTSGFSLVDSMFDVADLRVPLLQ